MKTIYNFNSAVVQLEDAMVEHLGKVGMQSYRNATVVGIFDSSIHHQKEFSQLKGIMKYDRITHVIYASLESIMDGRVLDEIQYVKDLKGPVYKPYMPKKHMVTWEDSMDRTGLVVADTVRSGQMLLHDGVSWHPSEPTRFTRGTSPDTPIKRSKSDKGALDEKKGTMVMVNRKHAIKHIKDSMFLKSSLVSMMVEAELAMISPYILRILEDEVIYQQDPELAKEIGISEGIKRDINLTELLKILNNGKDNKKP